MTQRSTDENHFFAVEERQAKMTRGNLTRILKVFESKLWKEQTMPDNDEYRFLCNLHS